MIKHILFVFILIFNSCLVVGQEIKFEKHQPLIDDIFSWGDLILIRGEGVRNTDDNINKTINKLFVCYLDSTYLEALMIDSDSLVLDVAESKNKLYAIVERDNEFLLLTKSKHGTEWESHPMFAEFANLSKYRLLAIDELQILFTEDYLYYSEDGIAWQKIRNKLIFDRGVYLNSIEKIPNTFILTEDKLIFGFDLGEWGGDLWEVPISLEDKQHIFKEGRKILSDNIHTIQYDENGILWIATTFAHGTFRNIGIHTYENQERKQILGLKNALLSFDTKSDFLSGFFIKNGDIPYFISTEQGVFRIVDNKIEHILDTNLYLFYSMPHYNVYSSPEGLFVDSNDNIFIAQRSLGVFSYKKVNNEYVYKQIVFKK